MYVGGGRSEECVRQTVWNRDSSKPSVVFRQFNSACLWILYIVSEIKIHISCFYIT